MYGFEDDYSFGIQEYSIADVREDLASVVKFFREQPYHDHAMQLFMIDYRKMPIEVVNECECFCIDEDMPISDFPEWMQSEPLGLVKKDYCTMWGRCVFPVKDTHGSVMGFVGWDPTTEPKYLDSKNYGYKAKATTLYGMEKLPEYYTNKEPVFVTEGLMCCLYLRWKGFQAMASLGSWLTPYQIQILRRFGNRLVMIPDNDETGDKYVKQIKRELPKALIAQVKFGKDIDGCRKCEDGIYEKELLNDLKIISNPFARTNILMRR